MASLYQNIRGCLQSRALATPGFPARCAFEGALFSSTVGTPWARLTLMPQMGRPYSVSAGLMRHSGLFQVSVFLPAGGGPGTGAAEAIADAVKARFVAGMKLAQGGETVEIEYAERSQAMVEADWISAPVTVGWRCFSPNN